MGDAPANTSPIQADRVLAELVSRLVDVYRPERIYLFGSIARGEASAESDYDLMVVLPDDTPAALRDSRRAYKAIWRLGAAADVLVWTRADFDGRLHLKASLPSTICREGKLVHAA